MLALRYVTLLLTSFLSLCIIWLVFPENLIGIEHRRYIMTVRYSSSTAFQMISNIQTKEQAVIVLRRVVNPIQVSNQGVKEGAQLQELMPVLVGARQARHLHPEDHPDVIQAHLRDQPLEPDPPLRTGPALAQIITHPQEAVAGPPQRPGSTDQ